MPGIKDKVPDFEEDKQLKVEDDCSSPYDFFLKFVDMQFLDMVEEKSKLYAVRKGAPEDVKYITKDRGRGRGHHASDWLLDSIFEKVRLFFQKQTL